MNHVFRRAVDGADEWFRGGSVSALIRRKTAVLLCLVAVSGQPDVNPHFAQYKHPCHSGLTTLQDTTRIGQSVAKISSTWMQGCSQI